jgi:2-oxo-3-hexenedioate decarboxylase
VYDTTLLRAQGRRASAELGGFAEPRIEPEIVLHFQAAPPVTRDELAILDCIDWIAHGFEIVQSPFLGWKFHAADTVTAALPIGPGETWSTTLSSIDLPGLTITFQTAAGQR